MGNGILTDVMKLSSHLVGLGWSLIYGLEFLKRHIWRETCKKHCHVNLEAEMERCGYKPKNARREQRVREGSSTEPSLWLCWDLERRDPQFVALCSKPILGYIHGHTAPSSANATRV